MIIFEDDELTSKNLHSAPAHTKTVPTSDATANSDTECKRDATANHITPSSFSVKNEPIGTACAKSNECNVAGSNPSTSNTIMSVGAKASERNVNAMADGEPAASKTQTQTQTQTQTESMKSDQNVVNIDKTNSEDGSVKREQTNVCEQHAQNTDLAHTTVATSGKACTSKPNAIESQSNRMSVAPESQHESTSPCQGVEKRAPQTHANASYRPKNGVLVNEDRSTGISNLAPNVDKSSKLAPNVHHARNHTEEIITDSKRAHDHVFADRAPLSCGADLSNNSKSNTDKALLSNCSEDIGANLERFCAGKLPRISSEGEDEDIGEKCTGQTSSDEYSTGMRARVCMYVCMYVCITCAESSSIGDSHVHACTHAHTHMQYTRIHMRIYIPLHIHTQRCRKQDERGLYTHSCVYIHRCREQQH